MKNLAGDQKADETILEELYLAGIPAIKVDKTTGEVSFSYVGKIGNWTFSRRWYYWSVSVEDKMNGIPVELALELHNRKHPTREEILGDTIRAGGHAGGISPDDYVGQPINNAEFVTECKELGIEMHSLKSLGIGEDETEYPKLNYGEIAELCNEGKIKAKRYISCYHIDEQIGLNEFVKTISAIMKYRVKFECYWRNTGAADNHYYENFEDFDTMEKAEAFKKRVDTQFKNSKRRVLYKHSKNEPASDYELKYNPPIASEELDAWNKSENFVEVENGFIEGEGTIVKYSPEREVSI